MVAQPQQTRFTPEEYLAFERASDTKHEYWDGEIVAMTGARFNHNMIVTNVVTMLNNRLRKHGCRTLANDMRVKIGMSKRLLYVYPDIVMVCGEPQFEDGVFDTLQNPHLVIEVLSESTEHIDRGAKFSAYRALPSLWGYILISQVQAKVEYFYRDDNGMWTIGEANELSESIPLARLDESLPLDEIYQDVVFPTEEAGE
jgi:Uma2 family endonuclease